MSITLPPLPLPCTYDVAFAMPLWSEKQLRARDLEVAKVVLEAAAKYVEELPCACCSTHKRLCICSLQETQIGLHRTYSLIPVRMLYGRALPQEWAAFFMANPALEKYIKTGRSPSAP